MPVQKLLPGRLPGSAPLALVHLPGNRHQHKPKRVDPSVRVQNPLSRPRICSTEPPHLHADRVFGPYDVIPVAAGVISAGELRPTSTARSAIWGETSSHRPGQIQSSGLPAICENTQDRIQHCVQILRDVIDEETQNNITVLLQNSVLAPVTAVRNRVA
jgi:hypothetical protein